MFSILLVEDSPAVARTIREGLRRSVNIPVDLYVAEDGEAGLAFMRCSNAPRPNLVMLDWNLPGLHGREVLEEIQSDPSLSTVPTVVLTASESDEDLVEAYARGAQCFITRPTDSVELERRLCSVVDFWASVS